MSSAYELGLKLEREIAALINTFQDITDLRVSEVIITDNGFHQGHPVKTSVSVETEEA